MDLSLHVELVAFDLKGSFTNSTGLRRALGQDQALLSHVLFNLLKSDLGVGNIVGFTEVSE